MIFLNLLPEDCSSEKSPLEEVRMRSWLRVFQPPLNQMGGPCLCYLVIIRKPSRGARVLRSRDREFQLVPHAEMGKCVWLIWVTAAQAARTGRSHRHPYDLGMFGNVSSTCGPRPSTWLVPTARSAHGDGLSFPTYLDDDLDIFSTGRRL